MRVETRPSPVSGRPSPAVPGGPSPAVSGGPSPAVSGGPAVRGRPSVGARLLLAVFRAYQLVRIGRVSPCRFTPTCSHYAIEAVARHGAGRGLRLAVRRLGRCRPGGPSGYDPVPE